MNNAEMLREIGAAMGGLGRDDSGCLEFCDGEPAELREEQNALMLATTEIISSEKPNPSAQVALIERAKRFGSAVSEVEGVCARECEGAYNLFEDDGDLYDSEGSPVVRTCPIKDRLAQVALNFSVSAS